MPLNSHTNSTPNEDIQGTSELNKVSLRLNNFWPNKPAAWFGRAEAQFNYAQITRSRTKFDAVASILEEDQCDIILDLLTSPPPEDQDPYGQLKNRLLAENKISDTKRYKTLLNDMVLGDKKPSTLLREMKVLAPEIDETFLRNVWMERLPPHMRGILSATDVSDLAKLGVTADAIAENTVALGIQQMSVQHPNNNPLEEVLQKLKELTIKVDKVSQRMDRLDATKRHRSKTPARSNMCYFHTKFGNKATKCQPPCAFKCTETNNDTKNE